MSDDRLLEAALNNAEWCDAVCRAHGSPGTFTALSWTNPASSPPYYPDAITLAPAAGWPDLLPGVEGKPSASVKDSFALVEPPGWDLLFEARWIYRPFHAAEAAPAATGDVIAWEVVRDAATLRDWERACFPGADLGLFPAALLGEVTFLAGRIGGDIVCGSALNGSGRVAGVSNLFALGCDLDAAWSGTVATAAELFPGRPLVGYETDPEPASRHGFLPIGPLRVWIKP
ncbi:hypothetical protein [Nonomuraea rhizosphaerae]|uniref:hypothetical protein n=1 Tax=Nonomuraea rhizosphaerae TaxID=2665663 RepID=UPI001C60019A|nr:hypothetical protein [Nonomuraea rhizosphaerae]